MEIEMGEKEGGEQITFITAFLEVKNSQTWNNGVCVCVCVCVKGDQSLMPRSVESFRIALASYTFLYTWRSESILDCSLMILRF